MTANPASLQRCLCQQYFRHGAAASNIPARRPSQQQTSSGVEKYSGLASNLAHLCRICKLAAAVCGISQHLLTYMRPSHLLPPWAAAQTDANLPAHLYRLPTPPPYLRQMRLLPGRGRRCCVQDEAVASQGRSVGWQMMLLVVRGAVPANHRARLQKLINCV